MLPCGLLLLAVASLNAQPQLSIVQDTLYKADGTKFDGILQIDWPSFQTSDGAEIAQQTITVRVANGNLRVALTPTTTALKPVNYRVSYNSNGRVQFTEHWSVPPSFTILRVRDVRTSASADPVTSPTGSVGIQDVSGLRTELDLRPVRGAGWIQGRAAVIGVSGGLEAALGQPGDCVRVDGTSGPCGTGGVTFVDGEKPAGTKDGINRTYQLTTPPNPAGSLALFKNGLLMKNGVGYTLSGSTITIAAGHELAAEDDMQAWYRSESGATVTLNVQTSETPQGTQDGLNNTFGLTYAPLPASSLQLYRNGLLQKAGVDYVLSTNQVTFLSVSTPVPGDILQASYRY